MLLNWLTRPSLRVMEMLLSSSTSSTPFFLGQLGHGARLIVAVVHYIHVLIVVHQEGDEAVAKALLHHDELGPSVMSLLVISS